jgi:hypothetical protein
MIKKFKDTLITLSVDSASNGEESDYFIPICPKCGENYLHHGSVSIYYRTMEDAVTGVLSVCEGGGNGDISVSHKAPMDNNPSRRRDGLAIDMECETCGPVGRMTIAQHKGQTLIGWQA